MLRVIPTKIYFMTYVFFVILTLTTGQRLSFYKPRRNDLVDYTGSNYIKTRSDSFTFEVRLSNDAHILLQNKKDDYHNNVVEIVIGGFGNTMSVIRQEQQGSPHASHKESGIVSAQSYRHFWISWSKHNEGSIDKVLVRVGKGQTENSNRFMETWLTYPRQAFSVNYARFGNGYGSDGSWIIHFLCAPISNCASTACNAHKPDDSTCTSCEHNQYFYKTDITWKHCNRMCAWNNHYCWPGTCGDGLVKNCQCASGFHLTSNSSETSCQPRSRPFFETCSTRSLVPNGKMKTSTTTGPTTACQYQNDYYGNFQPKQHHLNVLVRYPVDSSAFPQKAPYIESSHFGITDFTVDSLLRRIAAADQILHSIPVLTDTTYSKNVKETFSDERSLNVTLNTTLHSGDRLSESDVSFRGKIIISSSETTCYGDSGIFWCATCIYRKISRRQFTLISGLYYGFTSMSANLVISRQNHRLLDINVWRKKCEWNTDSRVPGGLSVNSAVIMTLAVTVQVLEVLM